MAMVRLLVVGLVVAGAMSCSVEIALEERPCPCGSGWTCDEEQNLCFRGEHRQCGLALPTERSSVRIEDFEVRWRTDEAIALRWTIDEASLSLVDHYELVVGTDEDQVLQRGEGVTIFDGDAGEHPELERSTLPYTGGNDDVDRVVLRELEPDTTYYLRLTVFDTSGAVSCSRVLGVLTWPPTVRRLSLYDESPPSTPLPTCMEQVEDAAEASSGRVCSRYRARCERRESGLGIAICEEPEIVAETCYENLRLMGLELVQHHFSEGEFAAAHLRLDLALDETGHSFWSEIGLYGPAPSPEDDPGALPGQYLWLERRRTFVADGTYRTYSSLLAAMSLRCTESQQEADELRVAAGAEPECSRKMTIEDARRGFTGVRAGGSLTHQGSFRLDNAALHF